MCALFREHFEGRGNSVCDGTRTGGSWGRGLGHDGSDRALLSGRGLHCCVETWPRRADAVGLCRPRARGMWTCPEGQPSQGWAERTCYLSEGLALAAPAERCGGELRRACGFLSTSGCPFSVVHCSQGPQRKRGVKEARWVVGAYPPCSPVCVGWGLLGQSAFREEALNSTGRLLGEMAVT